jgi:hypothetical protein
MSGLRQSPPPEAELELGKKIEYVYDQVCGLKPLVGLALLT